MKIPNYQHFMAPALRALQDGSARPRGEISDLVASELGITEEQRAQRIPSGKAGVFDSRVGWALTYMVQAGLVERPQRALNRITQRGLDVLAEHPAAVNNHVLEQFAEFQEFRARSGKKPAQENDDGIGGEDGPKPPGDESPIETIQRAVDEINNTVATELLTRVRAQSPDFLERLVLELLTAMGYAGAAGSAEHLGKSGDEGLDGVIKQDKLGLDRIYVQAKRYAEDNTVGRPEIQGFVGALHGAQADRGVFITTSRFSPGARDYARKVNAQVVLVDGLKLTSLMVEHNVGAQDNEAFVVKKLDEDYFDPA
ncbi:restriction endonuclease [Microlunatus aurantiacus]|uniref:Restriction endonuclease n=1 Tax=Microlunatus aurantiacus TaxID=446786 RepID=A0ABP7EMX3_9ACTN